MLHRPEVARPCPLCGAVALFDNREIVPKGAAPWNCENCFFEGSAEEMLATMRREAAAAWESWPSFVREIVTTPDATVAVRRLALPLLECGVAREIVEQLARLVNGQRVRPASEDELLATVAASARSASRLRLVA